MYSKNFVYCMIGAYMLEIAFSNSQTQSPHNYLQMRITWKGFPTGRGSDEREGVFHRHSWENGSQCAGRSSGCMVARS